MSVGELNATVEEIRKGSFDLHVHAGPDPSKERRLDALEVARYAYEAEMGGFVLKSHDYPTAPLAYALNRMYPGLTVLGSVTLNQSVGGLNSEAVEVAGRLGAKVVWMPTHSADFNSKGREKGTGIRLVDDDGELRDKVHDVLETAARWDMVIASGHVSPRETLALFKAARNAGIERLIATHPGRGRYDGRAARYGVAERLPGIYVPLMHAFGQPYQPRRPGGHAESFRRGQLRGDYGFRSAGESTTR